MPPMKPKDVYRLAGASDPRLDPTGRKVAYVVTHVDKERNEYGAAVWVVPVDGSTPPRQFTTGDSSASSPRWSPDGKWLAFVSKRGEEKTPQLYVMPANGGEGQKVTDLKEAPEGVAWSPDSSQLAFCARVPDKTYEEEDDKKREPRRIHQLLSRWDNIGWTIDRRQQIFVVPRNGSTPPTALTKNDQENYDPTWSPDGKQIAFTSMPGDEFVEQLFLVNANGKGRPKQITSTNDLYATPTFNEDGTKIAYRFERNDATYPHNTGIGVLDPKTGKAKLLTKKLDRHCAPATGGREPIWDGDRIIFPIEDHGNVHLYSVAAGDRSPQPKLLVGGEQVIGSHDLANGTLVHATSTHTKLSEIYVGDRQLTNVNRGFRPTLIEPQRFTAISKDGTEVDAWLMKPAGFKGGQKYPVLLNVHGGPFTQYTTGFFDEFQVYAGAGYAVLFANPRGSAGLSEEWGQAVRGPIGGIGPGFGTVDFEDVMGVLDTALKKFRFLDKDRLGIMGGSYGGYMTTWAVGHTNRFKAAISERSLNNWASFAGSSDIAGFFGKKYLGGEVWDYPDEYRKHSPATYVKNIKTPLLIIHSEDDIRCPIEQANQLYIALRNLKRDVEFVRFPAESHELSRSGSPFHRVRRFEIILDYLKRKLA